MRNGMGLVCDIFFYRLIFDDDDTANPYTDI
jgi:hypothetical protein